MNNDDSLIEQRRRVLRLLGTSAALVPLAGLTACGGGDDSSSAGSAAMEEATEAAESVENTMESAMDSAEETMESAADEMESAADDMAARAGGQDLPLLAESDAQAKSLGYVEDASTVDAAKYPRYESGQACSNCALYMGGDKPKGACSIFPGKAVKATGWCSVWAPKAG